MVVNWWDKKSSHKQTSAVFILCGLVWKAQAKILRSLYFYIYLAKLEFSETCVEVRFRYISSGLISAEMIEERACCVANFWKYFSLFLFIVGDGDTLNLYSCAGDGSVLEHKTGHFMDDAVDVNALILKTNNLKVCVDWNFSLLLPLEVNCDTSKTQLQRSVCPLILMQNERCWTCGLVCQTKEKSTFG